MHNFFFANASHFSRESERLHQLIYRWLLSTAEKMRVGMAELLCYYQKEKRGGWLPFRSRATRNGWKTGLCRKSYSVYEVIYALTPLLQTSDDEIDECLHSWAQQASPQLRWGSISSSCQSVCLPFSLVVVVGTVQSLDVHFAMPLD